MRLRYTVVFEKDEDGWVVASAPALGCAAQGRTRRAALRSLEETVESYLLARRAKGWSIPRESDATVSTIQVAV
ncbi:MAG: type II toxin-antitoxin system HicB family antitoxin [Myxococcota bacterium]